ncbi:iron ABC transporter permease [candidate division WOR-3 bacterium]|nr:iron ABC transporter permease [candidate division WOR-3 bacterium]
MKTVLTKKKLAIVLFCHALPAFFLLSAAPLFGAVQISISDLLKEGVLRDIFFDYRIPRALTAFLLGGGLSLSGAILQSTLKNPLVEPYTLGLSSVSSLGAYLALTYLPFIALSGIFFSLLFSSLTTVFIYIFSSRRKIFSVHDLVLAGITLSIFAGSSITLLRFISNPFTSGSIDRWLAGSLAFANWPNFFWSFVFACPLIVFSFFNMNSYNHLFFSDEISYSRGINVQSLQKISFLMVSLFTAGCVAFFGPIGFVGLIVPHAERKISGNDYRLLLPSSFFSGAAFLTIADIVSRKAVQPSELPVGVVTALLGAPFFLYILLWDKNKEKH